MEATELDAIAYTLGQFAGFYSFLLAAQELGEVTIKDSNVFAQFSAGGASDMLTIRDLRRCNKLLANLKEKYPDEACWTSERGLLPDPVLGDQSYLE